MLRKVSEKPKWAKSGASSVLSARDKLLDSESTPKLTQSRVDGGNAERAHPSGAGKAPAHDEDLGGRSISKLEKLQTDTNNPNHAKL